jgi:type IV pilus assembly protein PilE
MNQKQGFSLIELMITIAIVGILASIAYPLYTGYLNKSHRAQAQQNLLLLSQKMELFHARHHNYTNATLQSIAPPDVLNNRYYRYAITELTTTSYLLAATPINTDKKCGILTLDQLGENGRSGSAPLQECWLG